MKGILIIIILMSVFSSSQPQSIVKVVPDVDIKRYAGKWYEIARLPNSFEKKLKCITATYTLRSDGRITVLNAGTNISDNKKKSSIEGIAWIPDKGNPAKLKVQFFWPFSGNYWIMELDKDYRYALIGDPSRKYLWILARENKLEEETYKMLLRKAVEDGYNVDAIIKVEQDCE
jgi:apolipoprotein D and lipocalin family protein